MRPISGETRLVGVIGDPIRHSRSPAIFNAAFDVLGLDWRMLAMPVDPGDAGAAVRGLRALGVQGCSVTMPHKATVIEHLDAISPAATSLRAVNCIRRDGDGLIGENTDGAGFVNALAADTAVSPRDRRCAVVGAGGAARAVIVALASAGAAHIDVINRTYASAAEAVAMAAASGCSASVADMAAVSSADLVVQTTPIGMSNGDGSAIPGELFGPGQVMADLIYHPAVTPTMVVAEAAGATVTNGLSMLVHQAAVQFTHWTGEPAPIDAMRSAVA